MLVKGLTLRGLEVFEALAASGSVAQAAEATGLSQPAVSQQLRNLETALGIDLVDHGKRPMQLTPAGRNFLSRTASVLSELRLAQSELTVMDLSHLPTLSFAIIDDFDNELTPKLVAILAESLTNCSFKQITAYSHEILSAMKEGSLHIGVAASTGEIIEGITEYPLVRDPFILVAPSNAPGPKPDPETIIKTSPFLSYEPSQLIAKMIDAHFKRLELDYPSRFEIGSHQSLMALVARGFGWTVTTAFGYMRAARFHDDLTAYPLPFAPLERRISLFASTDWSDRVPRDVAGTMRNLLAGQVVDPALRRLPWLDGQCEVLRA